MIIMEKAATNEEINNVIGVVEKCGVKADVSRGAFRTVIGLVGDESKVPFDYLASMPGVKEARMVESPYKLISREYGQGENRVIRVKGVEVGGEEPIFIAGPCAVESKAQLYRIAEEVKHAGAQMLRGGIFKPRSSAHSFQGLGSQGEAEAEEALSWLQEAGNKFEMPVVTEVRGEAYVHLVARYSDIIQIGARNMYNQDLLVKVAKTGLPVLFKRHFGASVEEFLSYSEYIAAQGNKDIILCERGIVPIGKGKGFTRYTLDLASVPVVQTESYLPIIVDPSHAAGRRDLIYNLSCAAIGVGADGLIIETHYEPSTAIVDGQQMITPGELGRIIEAAKEISRMTAPGKIRNRVKAR